MDIVLDSNYSYRSRFCVYCAAYYYDTHTHSHKRKKRHINSLWQHRQDEMMHGERPPPSPIQPPYRPIASQPIEATDRSHTHPSPHITTIHPTHSPAARTVGWIMDRCENENRSGRISFWLTRFISGLPDGAHLVDRAALLDDCLSTDWLTADKR